LQALEARMLSDPLADDGDTEAAQVDMFTVQ
jgi:hypothetical protein